jgi:transcriptional regulator with XRE-family HTH domain
MDIATQMNRLKRLLADARERKSLTLRQLTALTGVDHATISYLERGRIKPSKKTIEKLTTALSLSEAEKQELHALIDGLPEFKLVKQKRSGDASSQAIRTFAMLAGVPGEDVREAWLQKISGNDYDIILILRGDKAVGLKLDGVSRFYVAEGFSMDDLPPLANALHKEIMTRLLPR